MNKAVAIGDTVTVLKRYGGKMEVECVGVSEHGIYGREKGAPATTTRFYNWDEVEVHEEPVDRIKELEKEVALLSNIVILFVEGSPETAKDLLHRLKEYK